MMCACSHTGLQARKRDGRHAHALQAHRDEWRRDRLAVGHEHVELTRGWVGVDTLRKRDQAVRGVSHRGDDRDDLLPSLDRTCDSPAHAPDGGGGSQLCPAILLIYHRVLSFPVSVTRVTLALPPCGAAASIALEMRRA